MNILNIIQFGGGIAFVIALIAIFMKSKKSIKVAKFSFVIAAIGLLTLVPVVSTFISDNVPAITNTLAIGGTTLAVGDTSPDSIIVNGEACYIEDTTVTLSALNKDTSLATGGTHRYKLNGAPALTVSNAGTFTASPGDTLSILWMNGSETDSNYFSEISTETVPCKGTKTFTKNIYGNGTVTFEVYNQEGNLISGNSENETLAAGDVVDLPVKIRTAYQTAQEYGGVLVFEYASDTIDDVVLNLGGEKVATPDFYNVNNGSQSTRAYSIPPFYGTGDVLGTIHIDVDDSRDPTGVPTDVINWTYYPYDYFINEDEGASWQLGIQDEDSAQTKKYSVTSAITLD